MPGQNLLIQGYKRFNPAFLICRNCYWCATAIHGPAPTTCLACGQDVASIPLSAQEAEVVNS